MTDPCTQYCEDVVSGKILSGELAIAAASRHLDDLVHGPSRGFTWQPELAERPLAFLPSVFSITDGERMGQPFHPLPYHIFLIGSLYGWRRADGTRRFRSVWIETGKGQAKGPLMASLALYELFFCGRSRSEGYCIGSTIVTSSALFRDAVAFCRTTIPGAEDGDCLEERGVVVIRGSGSMSWMIERIDTQSKFQALAIGDSMSGPKPSVVLIDEVHEFKSDTPIEMWSAMLAKSSGSPLMMLATNTPATNQIVGTTYSDYYQAVAKREYHDDSSLAYIARTDKSDDPMNDPACWIKSLPALDITYSSQNVAIEVAKATRMASKRLSVLRLYFGVPVGTESFWIDEDCWESVQGDVDEDEMRQYPCYLGLDLSSKNDLTALSQVWKAPTGHLYVKISYWKPKASLAQAEAEDHAPYAAWVADGYLNATPGMTISKEFVVAEVKKLCLTHDVRLMSFDPAFFTEFLQAASDVNFDCYELHPDKPAGVGLKMIRHAQGARGMHSEKTLWMPRSFRATCDAILDSSITIQRNPVTTYCASNVVLEHDSQDNQWIGKRKTRSHNDGIVAAVMGIGAAMHTMVEKPVFTSIWSEDFYPAPIP